MHLDSLPRLAPQVEPRATRQMALALRSTREVRRHGRGEECRVEGSRIDARERADRHPCVRRAAHDSCARPRGIRREAGQAIPDHQDRSPGGPGESRAGRSRCPIRPSAASRSPQPLLDPKAHREDGAQRLAAEIREDRSSRTPGPEASLARWRRARRLIHVARAQSISPRSRDGSGLGYAVLNSPIQ